MHLKTINLVLISILSSSIADGSPMVTLRNGTVIGKTDGTVDTFLGIPFALPPTGTRRLRPPQPFTTTFGTMQATETPPACPPLFLNAPPDVFGQLPIDVLTDLVLAFAATNGTSEDCLTLNIQRPASAALHSKLPVLIWIYGGGFERGSTQDQDFAHFVKQSIQINHPVIVVQANYRVGVPGFLGGKELQQEGSTNLGLRDQRLAMQWVVDNIAAFGGDPHRITIWGESAGSFSVFDQTIINGGDHLYNGKPLFQGAIMNSGTLLPSLPIDSKTAQQVFDSVVEAAGCNSSSDSLACLRSIPEGVFLDAANVPPSLFNPSGVAITFHPRPDPSSSFFAESPDQAILSKPPRIANVPIIAGFQKDEGTIFSLGLKNASSNELFLDSLQTLLPETSRELLASFTNLYQQDPSNPLVGSPFGTGAENELYSGFKRYSAAFGDLFFILQTRLYRSAVSESVPIWGYQSAYGQLKYMGTSHGSDLILFKIQKPVAAYEHILQYYISFIYYQDPNKISHQNCGGKKLIEWPRWNSVDRYLIQFNDGDDEVIVEDFRETAFDYLRSIESEIRT
jgi:carboxylesterase type B